MDTRGTSLLSQHTDYLAHCPAQMRERPELGHERRASPERWRRHNVCTAPMLEESRSGRRCSPSSRCRVRMWRMDMSNAEEDYPWACTTVIHTGHRGNIFNAQMLPGSSRMYVPSLFHLLKLNIADTHSE